MELERERDDASSAVFCARVRAHTHTADIELAVSLEMLLVVSS